MVVEELARVAELNHNVRNALQVIRHSHTLERDEQAEAIVASVDRIDETLRRLFPALRTAEVASNTARSRLVRSMDVPRQPQSKNDTTSSANSHSDE
jgi:phage terminase Nu1 subunit (DNA packaging protein)